MPRDSNGNTQPLPGTIVATGDTVLPSQHNPMVNDVYAMMTQSLSRDGQGGMRFNLDMSTYRIINVANGTAPTDAVNLSQINVLDPLGIPKPYCGTTAPSGYLFCYGQAISRTTYAALFAVLGTMWGAGNGTTTFNLPDFRGRVLAGKDDMGGVSANRLTGPVLGSINGDVLANTGGEQAHVITVAEMTSHGHGVNDPGHVHAYGRPVASLDNDRGTQGSVWSIDNSETVNTSSAGTGITLQANGGDGPHNNIQPTIIVNYILRTGV